MLRVQDVPSSLEVTSHKAYIKFLLDCALFFPEKDYKRKIIFTGRETKTVQEPLSEVASVRFPGSSSTVQLQ